MSRSIPRTSPRVNSWGMALREGVTAASCTYRHVYFNCFLSQVLSGYEQVIVYKSYLTQSTWKFQVFFLTHPVHRLVYKVYCAWLCYHFVLNIAPTNLHKSTNNIKRMIIVLPSETHLNGVSGVTPRPTNICLTHVQSNTELESQCFYSPKGLGVIVIH